MENVKEMLEYIDRTDFTKNNYAQTRERWKEEDCDPVVYYAYNGGEDFYHYMGRAFHCDKEILSKFTDSDIESAVKFAKLSREASLKYPNFWSHEKTELEIEEDRKFAEYVANCERTKIYLYIQDVNAERNEVYDIFLNIFGEDHWQEWHPVEVDAEIETIKRFLKVYKLELREDNGGEED